ncbi:multifunctional CCA addition/repair protein [Pseudoduganella sp. GCM10020061]|uniref:multifunctional CCA addition/repair protein n=1 Tax=Pseudoduganella sp. GCM10020061 TaxID=3317345 RepID=UPI003630EC31
MKTYVVGGAVRDALLGLPVKDRDHVVVGATPEQMVRLGYRPVGKDFPVFLHPRTQEEYALARTERKTAPGYHGFVFHTEPTVTLEDDLVRRDLTVNAIAQDEDGTLVDPFGGRADIERRVFRHVSGAFAEDPVRILRLARFAARFPDFTVAPETLALMRRMVDAGEVDALVAERVWQELARGLMEEKPSRMFEVLRDCGALARILPELDAAWDAPPGAGAHMMQVIDCAAAHGYGLCVRFAALMLGVGGQGGEAGGLARIDAVSRRLRVPNDCRDLAVMALRERNAVDHAASLDAEATVRLFERCDGFRKPERFAQLLLACECGALGGDELLRQHRRLLQALAVARGIDAGAIAAGAAGGRDAIPAAIHQARIAAVQALHGTGA